MRTEQLDSALAYIPRWLSYRAFLLRVPGVQWAVHAEGEVRGSGAVGVADLVTGEPLTAGHRFRIASHSKTFTATLILRLAEQGRLRLDDPVATWIDGAPDVTVRDLLEHGGGLLRDGADGDHWQHVRPFPDEAALLAAVAVKQGPDEAFAYSNLGYSLLGMVAARVTGTPYRELVTAEVLAPLGLTATAPDLPESTGPLAAGHSGLRTSRERHRIPHVDTHAMAAATGFVSTAADLVTFFSALRPGTGLLLGDRWKRLQQRRLQESAPGSGRWYGLGTITETLAGRTVFGHSGGYPGHITKTLVDPERGIAVSVLTNAVDGPASDLAAGVLGILDAAVADGSVEGDTAGFEGRFANLWGVMDVARLGDRLLAIDPTAAQPAEDPDVLEVVDERTLRVVSGDGFGSVREPIRYEPDGRIRAGSGMTMWPFREGEPFLHGSGGTA